MNSLEQVTGWAVNGRFFPEKDSALEEKRRLDFLEWCETKFGKRGKGFGQAVWAEYRLEPRTPLG